MIHIFGKYYAQVDENQIVVGVKIEEKQKDGSTKPRISNPRYYGTLENALRGTYKRLAIETLQDIDGELRDAIEALIGLQETFTEAINYSLPMLQAFDDDGK